MGITKIQRRVEKNVFNLVLARDIIRKGGREKKMKKITAILLILTMVFLFAACGTAENKSDDTEAGTNEIAGLFEDSEYYIGMSTYEEGVWKAIFQTEGFGKVLYAEARMTDEQYEAYEAIDYADEDYEERQKAIITSVEDVTIEDYKDRIPTQEDLDSWIGKTCGELESAEFYNSGNMIDDENETVYFYYDGPKYCVKVGFEPGQKLFIDDLSNNDIRALVIYSVEMTGLGFGIFE